MSPVQIQWKDNMFNSSHMQFHQYMVYVHLLGSTWWYTDQWVHRCEQVPSMSVHTYPSKATWPHRLLQSLQGLGALLDTISWALYDVLGLPNFQNPLHSEQQIWSGTLFVVLTLPRCMVNLHKGHHSLQLLTKKTSIYIYGYRYVYNQCPYQISQNFTYCSEIWL